MALRNEKLLSLQQKSRFASSPKQEALRHYSSPFRFFLIYFLFSLIVIPSLEAKALKEGDTAPRFVLSDAYGKKYDLLDYPATIKKRNLLLIFFRTGTCNVCIEQMLEVADRAVDIKKMDTAILTISMDDAIVLRSMEERVMKRFPVLMDSTGKAVRGFGAYNPAEKLARPSIFLINDQKKIVYQHVGRSLKDRPLTSKIVKLVKTNAALVEKRAGRQITSVPPKAKPTAARINVSNRKK